MASKRYELKTSRRKIFKPLHEEPGAFHLDYILLPYGQYYAKTKDYLDAKKGDILRFYNGPEYEIDSVSLIKQDRVCDILCRMRYGIAWKVAFAKWQSNAILEGYGRQALSTQECLLVIYGKKKTDTD